MPGPVTARLGAIARTHRVHLVIGVQEREPHGAAVYCTVLYFGPDGQLLNKHRKLIHTGSERTGVSRETARRAGIATVTSTLTAGVGVASLNRLDLGRAERIEIGRFRMRNIPVAIRIRNLIEPRVLEPGQRRQQDQHRRREERHAGNRPRPPHHDRSIAREKRRKCA